MPSLIPGYNYDIFISYRQKDNKYDGWVTRFVDNLKKELEATFKEDISVYFDENPHDRLQETYDVDKSLEGKLKCLIFIPILSQTYCDPNSYAWQHELLAFQQAVKSDRFGKDIKLRGGNVASRILPVRIHDLEPEDVRLLEKETGGVLRAMDFVFKTGTGAIRPLLPTEDHPNDNLNKTYYRDQISKVAIAIKEIILGMKAEPARVIKEKVKESFTEVKAEELKEIKKEPAKAVRMKFLIPIAIAAVLIIAGIIAYPEIFKRDTLERLRTSGERISVAVMPFQNMTNDTTKWDGYQEIIQSILTSTLSNFPKDIQVRQSPLVNNLIDNYEGFTTYSSITPSFAGKVSRKLETDIFINGNIIKAGNIIRLNAQIIDTRTDEIIKTFQIEGPPIEEELLHKVDSLSSLVSNFLIISKLNKELNSARQGEVMTESPEAFRCFIKGGNFYYKGQDSLAIPWFLKAIEIDSGFLRPKLLISWAYKHVGLYDEAKKWYRIVEKEKDVLPENFKLWVNCLHAELFETVSDEIYHLKQLLEIDDQQPEGYWALGIFYNLIGDYNRAIPEFKKALELYDKWDIKPLRVEDYSELGNAYLKTGQHRKAKKLYRKAEQDYPDNFIIIGSQAILFLAMGNMKDASQYFNKFKTILQDQGWSEARIARNLANIYNAANYLNDAEELYRKSLSLESKNSLLPVRLYALAYFLISTDRNINEGLALVDKAIEISPDNYEYLDTKGWGLYKLGKYQEALDLLQKSDSLKPVYDHELFLHLEAAKKAVAEQK